MRRQTPPWIKPPSDPNHPPPLLGKQGFSDPMRDIF